MVSSGSSIRSLMSNYPGSSSWDNAPPPAPSSSSSEAQALGGSTAGPPAGYSNGGAAMGGFDAAHDGGLGWGSGDRSAMYNMNAGWGRGEAFTLNLVLSSIGRPKHKQEVREGDW